MPNVTPPASTSLGLLSVILSAAVIFLIAAALAMRGEPCAFDREILIAMRLPGDPAISVGPAWLPRAARTITTLGGTPFLIILTTALAGYFIAKRERMSVAILLAVVIGQSVMVNALKDLFGRLRPDVVPHLVDISNYSFPSGHSSSAAAVFLSIAALVAREARERWVRQSLFVAAAMLALLVGASRIYLGVHYPTDVIGGLAFGTAWAAMVFLAARQLTQR